MLIILCREAFGGCRGRINRRWVLRLHRCIEGDRNTIYGSGLTPLNFNGSAMPFDSYDSTFIDAYDAVQTLEDHAVC